MNDAPNHEKRGRGAVDGFEYMWFKDETFWSFCAGQYQKKGIEVDHGSTGFGEWKRLSESLASARVICVVVVVIPPCNKQ